MSAIAPTLDLAPASFQALVDRLPPLQRASVAWFLPELRATFVAPLRAVDSEEELEGTLDAHLLTFAKLNAKLSAALIPLLQEATLRDIVIAVDDERVAETHRKIAERLGAVDGYGADALRDAYAWLSVVLPALVQVVASLSPQKAAEAVASTLNADDDAELVAAVKGSGRPLLQHASLTIAAIEAVEDEKQELPKLILRWCELALRGAQQSVRLLRGAGIVLQAPSVPGFTRKQWRERWADRIFDGFDDSDLDAFEAATTRLRSGRTGSR